jgi:hypothetical protein
MPQRRLKAFLPAVFYSKNFAIGPIKTAFENLGTRKFTIGIFRAISIGFRAILLEF